MPCKLEDWVHSAQQRGLLAREAFRKSEDTAAHCGVSLAYLEQLACSLKDGWTEAGAQADCSTAGVMQRLLMPVCARMAGKTRWASHVSAVCRVRAGSKECAVQSAQPDLWSLQQRTSLAVDVTASVCHLNTYISMHHHELITIVHLTLLHALACFPSSWAMQVLGHHPR